MDVSKQWDSKECFAAHVDGEYVVVGVDMLDLYAALEHWCADDDEYLHHANTRLHEVAERLYCYEALGMSPAEIAEMCRIVKKAAKYCGKCGITLAAQNIPAELCGYIDGMEGK